MKIVFLSDNFPPETNAAATRVYERAVYWARWGHDVTVITCAPNFPEGKVFPGYRNAWRQTEEMDGIRVVRVKTYIAANRGVLRRTLDFVSFGITGYLAAVREKGADVISATSPQFFSAVAGWAAGKRTGVPFVFELGDLWPASISAVGAMRPSLPLRLVEKIELFLYRQSAAVAALTHSFKANLVRRGIDADKIAVVINGVDLSRYAPQPRDEARSEAWNLESKFVVGYVGTHGMAHALGNVLDAAELLSHRDDIVFLFVGTGAERGRLIEEAEARSLKNVRFQPRQPKEDMPSIWSVCDVALVHLKDSPAFAEVIPSKIFEAQGMGLPVLLAAPQGEATRLIDDDSCGLSVGAEAPQALADAVIALAEDPDRLAAFRAASIEAAPRHSRSVQAAEMLDVLSHAAKGEGMSVGRLKLRAEPFLAKDSQA